MFHGDYSRATVKFPNISSTLHGTPMQVVVTGYHVTFNNITYKLNATIHCHSPKRELANGFP